MHNPLSGFKTIYDGINEIVEPLNPLVTNMNDKNKEIASGLIASGFTIKEIEDFVDVSTKQLSDFIAIEAEVQKRMAVATKKAA